MELSLPKFRSLGPVSKRDWLTLLGALAVLVAIPLTVILLKSYQETRIKALENAEIVGGSVKVTNIGSHGFAVSWATVGESIGYIRWSLAEGDLLQTSYDDRATGTDAQEATFSSSTHHVTLPYPPGDNREHEFFREPQQAYDFKIFSGDGKLYGGVFDGFFNVAGVLDSASAVTVATGPELLKRPLFTSKNLIAPLYFRRWPATPGKAEWSAFELSNNTASEAHVQLIFSGVNQSGSRVDLSFERTIGPNMTYGSHGVLDFENALKAHGEFKGQLRVESDQPLFGTVRHFFTDAAANYFKDPLTFAADMPLLSEEFNTTKLVAPLYVRQWSAGMRTTHRQWTDLFLLNRGDSEATFNLTFSGTNLNGERANQTFSGRKVAAGAMYSSLDDLPLDGLGRVAGFMVVESDKPLIGYVRDLFLEGENKDGILDIFTDTPAVPQSGEFLSNTLWAPLFMRHWISGGAETTEWSTIQLDNPSGNPIPFRLHFVGKNQAGEPKTLSVERTVPAQDAYNSYGDTDLHNQLAGLGGVSGYVKIESDWPLFGMIRHTLHDNTVAGPPSLAAPVLSLADEPLLARHFSSTKLLVPLFLYHWYSQRPDHSQWTDLALNNYGETAATVTLKFFGVKRSPDGWGQPAEPFTVGPKTIAPHSTYRTFEDQDVDVLGSRGDFAGFVLVESSQPVTAHIRALWFEGETRSGTMDLATAYLVYSRDGMERELLCQSTPEPDVAPSCPDPVFGEVQRTAGVAAPGTIVYLALKDGDGQNSSGSASPLSALTGSDGRYTIDLGNARNQDRSQFFAYNRHQGDQEDVFAQGGTYGQAALLNNPTSNDEPIPTLILNHPPTLEAIANQTTPENQAYTYQTVASDADDDQLTYGLGCPTGATCPSDIIIPTGMTISTSGLISWANPTPRGDSFKIRVWVSDGKSGGVAFTDYTLTVGTPTLNCSGSSVSADPSEVAPGGRTTLTATVVGGSGNFSYRWTANPDRGTFPNGNTTNPVEWQAPADATAGQQFTLRVEVTDTSTGATCSGANAISTIITIVPPTPVLASVTITPASKTLNVGQTWEFTAQAYDSNNQPIASGVTYAWGVTGTIGTRAPAAGQATTFTATTVGTGTVDVTATKDGRSVSAHAPVIVVEALSCTGSSITPQSFTVSPGGTKVLTANPVGGSGSYTYAWSVPANGGTFVGPTNERTATWKAPDDATVGQTFTLTVAITDTLTGTSCPSQVTATATIVPAGPYVTITPASSILNVGQTEEFTAQAYDANDNPITTGVTYTWEIPFIRDGDIGTIVPDPNDNRRATFTAMKVGSNVVRVNAAIGVETVSAQAPVIVVEALSCTGSSITPQSFTVSPGGTKVLTANPVGGSGSYTYAWSVPANGGTFVGPTNERTATWKAPDNATSGQTFTITVAITDTATQTSCPSQVTATATVVTALSCPVSPKTFPIAPGGTRNVAVTASGGSGSYTYAWSKSGGDFVGGATAVNIDWKAPQNATNGQTFTITATVTDTNTQSTCSDTSTATIAVAGPLTLDISLKMQGRPDYPRDSRGSNGKAGIFARKTGEAAKKWELSNLEIAADGTARNVALEGLSSGEAYEFLLKGYIHLQVKKSLTLGSANPINFGTILTGDVRSPADDQVNSLDNDILLTDWQQTWNSPQACPNTYRDCKLADFNLDSKVNSIDHDYTFGNWGENGDK